MRITTRAIPLTLAVLGLTLFAVVVAGLQESSDEKLVQASLMPKDIPAEARAQSNPFAKDPESAGRGKMIFSSQCTMCHGADGRGTGDLVERLSLVIPDFTNGDWHKQWTDGALFYVVSKGHGDMPGQKDRFDEKRKWDLVSYVRTFSK